MSATDPDYEYDAEWSLEEPRRVEPKPMLAIGPPPGFTPPPGFRQPPGLAAPGPSGTQRSAKGLARNNRDVDDTITFKTGTANGSFPRGRVPFNAIARRLPPPAPAQDFVTPIGDRDELAGFTRPNVFAHEEDDDYHDEEHPTGFRRANEADMAERAGQPPDAEYVLPSRRHYEFDIRFFGSRNNNILHIARKTGTHISMPTSLEQPILYMWGTPERLFLASEDLRRLSERVQTDIEQGVRRVGGWVKIRAMPTDRRQEMIDKMMLDAKIRKMYRQAPPVDFPFEAVGIFIWPTKEKNPQTALGMAFEALDDIRFDQHVFILFSRKRNMFRVLGDEQENVEIAVQRIHGVFCELAAKNRKPTRMCLVSPPSEHIRNTRVMSNEDHNLVNRQVTVKRVDENKGIQVYLYGPAPNARFKEFWKSKAPVMKEANAEYMRKALLQGLQDVNYYRGHVKLRVYLGKMVLFGYRRSKDGSYDINEFSEMVRNPQTAGEVIRYIGSTKHGVTDAEVAKELIKFCDERPDIFYPMDYNPDIMKTQDKNAPPLLEPIISATFELRLYDEKGTGQDIRLEVTFERMPGTQQYRPLHRRWLNATGEGRESFNRRRGPLDLKVMDLEEDMAYQIEMATWQVYQEAPVYPIFQDFIRNLSIEQIADEFAGIPPPPEGQPDTRPTVQRLSFVNLPGLSVVSVVQKTKWRYWMGSTNYIFEVTRYENLPASQVSALYPDAVPVSYKGLNMPFDTRWGTSIWHETWDEKLSQQAVAEIGCRGNWKPEIEEFFPHSNAGGIHNRSGGWGEDGFLEFLGRIKEAIDIVRRAQDNASMQKEAELLREAQSTTSSHWTGEEEFNS